MTIKSLEHLTPRKAVLDGTADFVVNLADLPKLPKPKRASSSTPTS